MEPGDIVAGGFRIEAMAGQGGMGTVYRAWDEDLQQRVAIKLLRQVREADIDRFLREAQVLKDFSHPGLVRYIEHGVTEAGIHYLVMEWIEGQTLAHRLELEGISVRETVEMGIRLSETIGALHAHGIVHRDLKPRNILFSEPGYAHPRIIDLGLARRMDAVSSLTQTGAVVGSPGYMSTEQARGDKNIGPTADVFALGSVLYECLTGQPAFHGIDANTLHARILLYSPPAPHTLNPDVPTALGTLVHQMLEKDAERRPVAHEVTAQLARLSLSDEPVFTRRVRRSEGTVESTRSGATPLIVVESPWKYLLIAGSADEDAPVPLSAAQLEKAARAIATFGGTFERMQGPRLVAMFRRPTEEQVGARVLMEWVVTLRRILPAVPMVVSQTGAAESLGLFVDRTMARLVADELDRTFAQTSGHPGGDAILIDDALVEAARAVAAVRTTRKGSYLVPPSGD